MQWLPSNGHNPFCVSSHRMTNLLSSHRIPHTNLILKKKPVAIHLTFTLLQHIYVILCFMYMYIKYQSTPASCCQFSPTWWPSDDEHPIIVTWIWTSMTKYLLAMPFENSYPCKQIEVFRYSHPKIWLFCHRNHLQDTLIDANKIEQVKELLIDVKIIKEKKLESNWFKEFLHT